MKEVKRPAFTAADALRAVDALRRPQTSPKIPFSSRAARAASPQVLERQQTGVNPNKQGKPIWKIS